MRASYKTLASLLWSTLAFAGSPAGTTRAYSGAGKGTAPCNTTLQACLDGSGSGDTVEIATNSLISEDLTLNKSVTLRSQDGFHAAIGSATAGDHQTLTFADAATALTVSLDGLDLSASDLLGVLGTAGGHHFSVTHCKVGRGVKFQWAKPISLTLGHNTLFNTNATAVISLKPTGSTDGSTVTVDGNELYNTTPTQSYDAVTYLDTGTGSTTALFTNNIIHNLAGCGCGGTAVFDLRPTTTGAATMFSIINNTVDAVTGDGGPVQVEAPSAGVMTVQIYNNSFSNLAYSYELQSVTAHLVIHYDRNNLYNVGTAYVYGYASGNGASDTAVDPHYLSGSTHDYRLQSTSALLGSGLSGFDQLPLTDFYGHPRINPSGVDLGAIERFADLGVSLSANPPNPAPGADVTLTAAIGNEGPYDLAAPKVTLTLPAGLVFKSASTPGGSCGGTSTVVCTLGPVSSGTVANVTLVATAQTLGAQQVSAELNDAVAPPTDPVSSNDNATVSVDVGGTLATDAGTPGDGGTHLADGGTGDSGNKAGCGCTSTSAEVPLLCGFLALVVLARRRTAA